MCQCLPIALKGPNKSKNSLTVHNATLPLWFILCVRFLFVLDPFVELHRIPWWPSVGKKLSSWLSVCAVLYLMPSYPFGILGRMLNAIATQNNNILNKKRNVTYIFSVSFL